MESEEIYKNLLLDFLDMCKQRITNGECTPEEINSFSDVAIEKLRLNATVSDIAKFYGKSENNVKVLMSRRDFQQKNPPKKIKVFDFARFSEIVPQSWRRRRKP